MDFHPPCVLLTGATGLVGGGLLQSLLAADPERRVVALTRRREKAQSLNRIPRVRALEADLNQPRLGLDEVVIPLLEASVTEIIHSAAEIRFGLPLEQARAANVGSTANLLEFARRCPRLKKFAHVSTVYVAGRSPGRIPEARASDRHGFINTYQQSKFEAEELVFEAMSELPAAIFRLSSIIGDSTTGRVRQFNHVHQLLRLLPRNLLPVAPVEPAASIDLIPGDWAVAALSYLFEKRFLPGRIYHVCAGPEGSLTVDQMIRLTVEAFESNGKSPRPGRIRLPKLLSLPDYEAYVEKTRRGDNALLKEVLRIMGFFLPHLAIFQVFENQKTSEALKDSGLTLPSIRSYYGKVVRYCLETNWGRQLPCGESES
jgi:nucleoside-diphosphate-sugar epimerase